MLHTVEEDNVYEVTFLSAEAACVPFGTGAQGNIVAVPGGACDIKDKLANAVAAGGSLPTPISLRFCNTCCRRCGVCAPLLL